MAKVHKSIRIGQLSVGFALFAIICGISLGNGAAVSAAVTSGPVSYVYSQKTDSEFPAEHIYGETETYSYAYATAEGSGNTEYRSAMPQEQDVDEIVLTFSYPSVGRVYLSALYDYSENRFLLPVLELFNRLEISYQAAGTTGLVEGTFLVGGENYRMNFQERSIVLGNKTYNFNADRMSTGPTDYYLSPEVYEEVFDMYFEINMSTLSVRLETPHAMPVTDRQNRERARRNIEQRSFERSYYPLRYDRSGQILGAGFIDYQINTAGDMSSPSRAFSYALTGGTNLFGGALQGNLSGRYEEDGRFSYRTDNLRWRYGLNPNPYLTEINAGQISTQGPLGRRIEGLSLSNEPIESRQLYGSYIVDGRTEPDSEVELYINNNLLDFTVADQLGYYRFEVPLRYGTTRLQTRIFTPDGGMQSRSREIQIPFMFLPRGTASYNIQAGRTDMPENPLSEDGLAAHGDIGYGFTDWITARVGLDYSETENGAPMLYGSATTRLFGHYLVTTDAVPNAFYRAQTSVVFPTSHSISVNYTYFDGISRFNPQAATQQINSSIYTPVSFLNGGIRAGADIITFNATARARLTSDFFTRVGRINLRLNYRDTVFREESQNRFSGGQLRASATYSISRNGSIPAPLRGTFVRANAVYSLEQEEIQQVDMQLSRSLGRSGRFTVGVSHLLPTSQTTGQIGINLDLGGRARSSSDFRARGGEYSYRQSVRGSVGLDTPHQYVQLSDRAQSGGAAATVTLFVDNSGSGTYEPDNGDEILPYNAVRLDRSAQARVGKDGRLRLMQLQSFYRYNVEVNRRAIPNPMLVPATDNFSFISDPNMYNQIEIPFYRTGVIDGEVVIMRNGERSGQGGLRMYLNGLDNDFSETIRSFHGGGFYAMDIPPGRYSLEVDPVQLDFLDVVARDGLLQFTVEPQAQGHFLSGIDLVLQPRDEPLEPALLVDSDTMKVLAEQVEAAVLADVHNAFNLFIRAQESLFNGRFAEARNHIEQSVRLFESDHAIALKGSIEYMLGNTAEARQLWQEANRRNPGIELPDTELLDQILNNGN